MKRLSILRALALLGLSASAFAQANVIPGTDVSLGSLGSFVSQGRQGAFPNGVNGMVMATTSCNPGSVDVPWLAAMSENHPMIAFLMVRESNGRLVQISDRSYVKHGFFAQSGNLCSTCQNPSPGTFLGVGCSDVYGTNNNGDNFWLAPPEEIDPWLGTWTAQCSYFDQGNPPVAPPFDCDGNRSLTQGQANALGQVGSRMNVTDAELNQPGTFWYQGHYVVLGEPAMNRFNNTSSRRVVPTWNGSSWSTSEPGGQLDGSVLQRWSGATVNFSTNGADDGHGWVGVVATPLGGDDWHYEYAVHNVDNQHAFGELRIPMAPGTTVTAAGFRDIDGNGANDWTFATTANEIVFSTGTNPLAWNTIYNFWFDANAGPLSDAVTLGQFFAGAGASSFTVAVPAPLDGCTPAASYCVGKVNSQACLPTISSTGFASVSGPGSFDIDATMVLNNTTGLLFFGAGSASLPFLGGTLCVAAPLQRTLVQFSGGNPPPQDCSGTYSFELNGLIQLGHPFLTVGSSAYAQYWYRDPAAGAHPVGLTDGLSFEVCP